MLNNGEPFDDFIIESSPYLRTMQTCAMVCKALHVGTFRLNYLFCEHLTPKMMVGENPIPMLTVKDLHSNEERDAFRQQYLDGIDFIDDNQFYDKVKDRYPESAT